MKPIIRTLRKGEELPADLKTGFEDTGIYPDWCWVVEKNGKLVACCLAMAGHGVCFLLRIVATKDAPNYWFVLLLRRLLRDCRKRGCLGFTAYFERPATPGEKLTIEQRLAKLAHNAGCMLIPSDGVWALGTMSIAEGRKRKGKGKG